MTRSTQPGLRFRTRKLSPKQLLPVLREDQIDSEEYKELLDNQYKVETGVEKSEENVSLLFLVYIIHISRDDVHILYHPSIGRAGIDVAMAAIRFYSNPRLYNPQTVIRNESTIYLLTFLRNTISRRLWPLPSGEAQRRRRKR